MSDDAVKVLYFASTKDIAKTSTETYKIATHPLLGDVIFAILERHPGLKQLVDNSCLITVNLEYTTDMNSELKPNDEIALIPPVSGG